MKTILVVDDDASIVIALENLLARAGYRVVSARDGLMAMEILNVERPDLILLDVTMPRMSGYDVCQHVREHEDWRHLPIVMLTGLGAEGERLKGLALGANGYVTKPFSPRELLALVGTHLGAATG
jgi:DNA-binding response OmpR family regulator